MRKILALLLLAAVMPGTLLREIPARRDMAAKLRFDGVALPRGAALRGNLGPFRLEGVWAMRSRNEAFGSYSALVPLADGRLLAVSDRGETLQFSPPGAERQPPVFGRLRHQKTLKKSAQDAESATRDPVTGQVWIGWEHDNAISRFGPNLERRQTVRPLAMRLWGQNSGAEAMVRLADGRFVVMAEGFAASAAAGGHPAVLFAGDPLHGARGRRFTFAGAPLFSPTDMAQLPDGRVLVLMRRLVWPFPLRFAGRIVVADPAEIRPGAVWRAREVAMLTSSLPVDNFEGIAVEPRGDGTVTVWLISDDNQAATQRTLLWKMALDPAAL